jgi:hypothetical protein
MWLVNFSRAVALLLLMEAGLSIRWHGWGGYQWRAQVCLAGCFLLMEPRRKGETARTRLQRPRQFVMLLLAAAAAVLFVLSFLALRNV